MDKAPKIENNQTQLNFIDLVESNISKRHKGSNKFYELKDNPNKIIRVESFDELKSKHNNKLEIDELIEVAKKSFTEMEEEYGISCSVDFVVSKDKNGKDVVCSISDRIEGKQLGNVEKTEKFVIKIKKLYSAIAKYFLYKFSDGGLYVWDINGESQYIYGKKQGDKEDKIYLIDTDIWLSRSKSDMYLSVYWLVRHMSWLEHRLGIRFQEARNYITEFINQPIPEKSDEQVKKNLDGIKDILNDKKSVYDPKSAIPRFE